jgi:RNA-directed DNA polymerase
VSQINRGKRTAGIDGVTVTTPEQRVNLVNEWQDYQPWRVKPVKRVYIPKANRKLRLLGIPCMSERIAQAVVKNALEPSWEARFEAHSYGFRPGRSCHDAIQQSWLRLQHGRDSWILSADIQGAFDHICRNYLLETIGNVPGRELIRPVA